MKTIIVNLYGGPGTGKSTICAGVFSKLKWKKVNCEMALEYAKDIVWEGTTTKFLNQPYIFAKQHSRLFRLLGKVDVIITDSPLLLSLHYNEGKANNKAFKAFVLEEYNKMYNIDIFLNRRKEYNPKGRYQTEEDAKKIDKALLKILNKHSKYFIKYEGEQESEEKIVNFIIGRLKRGTDSAI